MDYPNLDCSGFHWWHELSDSERQVIKDASDFKLFQILDAIPRQDLELMYKAIVPPTNLAGGYNRLQNEWLRDERWYLGSRLGEPPTEEQLFDDMEATGFRFRYRLYWAAKKTIERAGDAEKPFGICVMANNRAIDLLTNFFEDVLRAYNLLPEDYLKEERDISESFDSRFVESGLVAACA